MNRLFIIPILILIVLNFTTCKKKDADTIASKTITTDYQEYSNYEIITITADNFDFPASGYTCKLGGTTLDVISHDSKTIYIMVPSSAVSGQNKILIEAKEFTASATVTINPITNYPSDGKAYLKEYVDSLVSQLNIFANQQSDLALKDTLNNAISKLQAGKSTIDQLTPDQANILAKYFFTNSRAMQEFDENWATVDKGVLTSGEQRVNFDGPSTILKYQKILQGIGILLKQWDFKNATRATILTGLIGFVDAGDAIIDLVKAILNGEIKTYIEKAKVSFNIVSSWVYWAPVAYTEVVIDNANQSINYNRIDASSLEVHNNSDLTFNNYKATYRNMQASDASSSNSLLASLATTYTSVKNLWNSMAGNLFGMGTIDFAPAKTQNKTIKNLDGFTLSCSNPGISISPVSGTASSFHVKLSTADNTTKTGELSLKYTDEIGQITQAKYSISVLPAVDSVPIYMAAITGNWTMNWQNADNAQIDKFQFNSDGTGSYYWMKVSGESTGTNIDPSNAVYRIEWSVAESSPGIWYLYINYPDRGWFSSTRVFITPNAHCGINTGPGLYFLGQKE